MTEKTEAAKDSTETAATPPVEGEEAKKGAARSNAVWMGTAVGVGSAALVAALMYAKRRK
ncbi:MAG: hypothetical protein QM690_05550 [Sphingobium sp.]